MRVYLVIVQNDSIATVYGYDDYDSASAAFHTELAYRGTDRDSTMCAIINSEGTVLKQELWQREVVE